MFFEKNLLTSVKNVLNKGEFIIIKENEYNKEEFGATINFIKAKGLNIKTITNHLSDEI